MKTKYRVWQVIAKDVMAENEQDALDTIKFAHAKVLTKKLKVMD